MSEKPQYEIPEIPLLDKYLPPGTILPVKYWRSPVESYGRGEVPPMSSREFQELVDSVSYKPGFTFTADVDFMMNAVRLVIYQQTLDSKDGVTPTQIMHMSVISLEDLRAGGKPIAIEFLRHSILDAEEHEFREFFRVDGQAPYPAH